MTTAQGPHELPFVLPTTPAGTVTEHADFDVYRPDGADQPLPAVIFVPGHVPPGLPVRPRHWPVYRGYGQLAAGRGVVGVVVDQPFHVLRDVPALAVNLAAIVESVRALGEVDAQRIAIWAFSSGAMLAGRWLAESPDWLRCVSLTYPVLADPGADEPAPPADLVLPGRPLVLTMVGKEQAERQATVDRFLAKAHETGAAVRVIDVPGGQHGFDLLDHTEESRDAVLEAADAVFGHLLG